MGFARRHAALISAAIVAALLVTWHFGSGPQPRPTAPLQGFQASPTGPQSLKLRNDLAVTMHSAVSSLPVPSGGNAGGSLASWSNGLGNGFAADGVVTITASGTTTLTGPVGLYGGIVSPAMEFFLGKLNSGSDISLTSTAGYAEKVSFVGAFDYLAIGGVGATITPSGGQTVTVKAVPIQF